MAIYKRDKKNRRRPPKEGKLMEKKNMNTQTRYLCYRRSI